MKLVVTQNITLDGRIEMIGDWLDPIEQDEGVLAKTRELMIDEGALLLGRQTFTDFRGYWPHQHDDPTGLADHLNQVDKLVVSSTLEDPAWENSTVIRNWQQEVRDLRQVPGREVCVTGSIKLTHALFEEELVDEVRLFTYPVWQGRGRSLFPDGYAPTLRPLETATFGKGVVYAAYAPAR